MTDRNLFPGSTRDWLRRNGLAVSTGHHHRTLKITARGECWARAVLARQADQLAAKFERQVDQMAEHQLNGQVDRMVTRQFDEDDSL